ncbi:hypothetical protein Sste5344_009434 [Sporothrix stenoceras]
MTTKSNPKRETKTTRRIKHDTILAKCTDHIDESDTNLAPVLLDDDGPTPPTTPTPGERLLRSTSETRSRPSFGTDSGTSLGFGQKKQQKQQKQQPSPSARPSMQDERREPRMNSSVSEASDPSLESPRAITPDKPDTLEADDEDIPATPQLQTAKAATPSLHADDMHASSKDISFRSYKDCYIGTNYMLLIKAMQSGYEHYTKHIGRLYVLRDPNRSGLFKIGFSAREDIKKRWQETPCSAAAVKGERKPVFVSDVFPGAFKAESLVKASLRHRKMVNNCTLCKSSHAEWFWVEEDVIVALVHAWTAYVQSGIYNTSGYTTEAYHEFAARLLRITPARIHAKLAATLSLEPL